MLAPSSGGGPGGDDEQAPTNRAISKVASVRRREALSFMTAAALLC